MNSNSGDSAQELPSYSVSVLPGQVLEQEPPSYDQAINPKNPKQNQNATLHDSPTNQAANLHTQHNNSISNVRHSKKRSAIETNLVEKFPLFLVVIHALFLFFVAVASIGLQAKLIVQKAYFYYIFFNGFYAGLTALALFFLCIISSRVSKFRVFIFI